jgi:predicted AlkP superfamily pyrophosphatase or phosphodiesterase
MRALAAAALLAAASGAAQAPAIRHAVVIGVDGMSPAGIRDSKTPHIRGLMERGAWTFRARAVMPTSSSPNWASMIMAAPPDRHGVTSNKWQPGPDAIFPTIFRVLREERPSAAIGCFYEWKDFARLVEPKVADAMEHGASAADTVRRAIAWIRARRPALTFIHLDHVDHAGHEHGHGSAQYNAAVAEADALIGQVLAALPPDALVLVSSDHGGIGKSHGGASEAEIQIPWILAGPGVAAGEIAAPVNIYDTAATLAWALGLKPPAAWTGKPVLAAFR